MILSSGDRAAAGFPYRQVDINGLLPPGQDGEENRLDVFTAGDWVGSISNSTDAIQPFSASFAMDASVPPVSSFDLVTRFAFRPKDHGSEDVRELGFALQSIALRAQPRLREGGKLPILKLCPFSGVGDREAVIAHGSQIAAPDSPPRPVAAGPECRNSGGGDAGAPGALSPGAR